MWEGGLSGMKSCPLEGGSQAEMPYLLELNKAYTFLALLYLYQMDDLQYHTFPLIDLLDHI